MTRIKQIWIAMAMVLALATAAEASGKWDTQVTELAHKIAAAAGPGTATLELRNESSLPSEQVTAIRYSLEQRLRAEGILIRPEHEASVGIRVTLSENRRGRLWIAEVQQGTETRVTMLEIPEERAADKAASGPPMRLEASLLLSSSEPLLDAQLVHAPQEMLAALTTHSVMLFQRQGSHWEPLRELPITLQVAMPLDPRGRIVPVSGHPFDVYLPGGNCAAERDSSGAVALRCISSDDPWPLGEQSAYFNSGRNYFAGMLTPGIGRMPPPFFSAAMLPRTKYALWIFAGVDGRVTASDGTNQLQLGGAALAWSSDIAAVRTECGSSTQLLSSEGNDDPSSDSLQAFEIADREPAPASIPLKFSGSITALWSQPGSSTATAIVHSARGGYDAYSITLACNQ
jgi:hypothetical protein